MSLKSDIWEGVCTSMYKLTFTNVPFNHLAQKLYDIQTQFLGQSTQILGSKFERTNGLWSGVIFYKEGGHQDGC